MERSKFEYEFLITRLLDNKKKQKKQNPLICDDNGKIWLFTNLMHGSMEFKDIITLNLAVLSIRGWKLQTNPKVMVSLFVQSSIFSS